MMTPALTSLLAAACFWIFLHFGLAGPPIRTKLAGRLGERTWRGLFALLSLLGLGWLIWAFHLSQQPENFYGLWLPPEWLLWLPFFVMPFALLLLVCSLSTRSPTAVGGESALAAPEPAVGILRVTRHPMLWSFALWAAAHLAANGDFGSIVLFLAILVVALGGMPSIDAKRTRAMPEAFAAFTARTSILPFAAILAGRNRFVFAEIGWGRVGLALALWVAILILHPYAIGASAIPG